MDWLGQLDNLTKLIVFVILGLAATIGFLRYQTWERDFTITHLNSEIEQWKQQTITAQRERNELQARVEQVLNAVDAQDREVGHPWGEARSAIEELRSHHDKSP